MKKPRNLIKNLVVILLLSLFVTTIFSQSNSWIPYIGLGFRKFPIENASLSSSWKDYITYIVIVFLIPFGTGALFVLFMVFGCILTNYFEAPWGKYKYKFCLGCFVCLLISIIMLSILAFTFIIVEFLAIKTISESGMPLLIDLFNFGQTVESSLQTISESVDGMDTEIFQPIVDTIDDFNDYLVDISILSGNTKDAINESPQYFDKMNNLYILIDGKITFLEDVGLGPYNLNFTFPDKDDIFPTSPEDFTNIIDGKTFEAKKGVNDSKQAIVNAIEQFYPIINDSVKDFIDVAEEGLSQFVSALDYTGISNELLVGVQNSMIYILVSLIIFCSFILILYPLIYLISTLKFWKSYPCMYCLSGVSFCGVITYTIVGSFLIVFFFFVEDVCNQSGDYFKEASNHDDRLNTNITLPGGGTIDLNYFNLTHNIMQCSDNGTIQTYFDAAGISLVSMNFTEVFDGYMDGIIDGFNVFDFSSYHDILLDNVTKFSESISDSIPDDYVQRMNDLYSLVYNNINVEQLEIQGYIDMNDFLFAACAVSYNIQRGDITTFVAEELVPACGFTIQQNFTLMQVMKPQLIEYKLIIESPDFVNVQSNYTFIENTLIEMNDTLNNITKYLGVLKDMPSDAQLLLNDIFSLYTSLENDIRGIEGALVNKVNNQIRGVTVLRCGSLGNFFEILKSSGCGDLINATGMVGVVCCIFILLFFFMFWMMLYSANMLKDWENNESKEDYDSELDDLSSHEEKDRDSFSSGSSDSY